MNLSVLLQSLLPQVFLTKLIGKIVSCRNKTIKNYLIKRFIRKYKINLDEVADCHFDSYENFNAFFARALKKEARPIEMSSVIAIAPADGVLSQFGDINGNQLIQAKGFMYDLKTLLGPKLKKFLPDFVNGKFATIYLSPRDYHRVHMPLDGQLVAMSAINGTLFSVNDSTTRNLPQLFTKNERVILVFKTDYGYIALILVGALLVASVRTTFAGLVNYNHPQQIKFKDYQSEQLFFKKGDHIASFEFGSTVIMLTESSWNFVPGLEIEKDIKFGEKLFQ